MGGLSRGGMTEMGCFCSNELIGSDAAVGGRKACRRRLEYVRLHETVLCLLRGLSE